MGGGTAGFYCCEAKAKKRKRALDQEPVCHVPFLAVRHNERIALLAIGPDGSVPAPDPKLTRQSNCTVIQAAAKKLGATYKPTGTWTTAVRRVYHIAERWKFGISKGPRKQQQAGSFSQVDAQASKALSACLERHPQHAGLARWKQGKLEEGAAAAPAASEGLAGQVLVQLGSGGSSSPEEATSESSDGGSGPAQAPPEPEVQGPSTAEPEEGPKAARLRSKLRDLQAEKEQLQRSIAGVEGKRSRLAELKAERRALKARVKELRGELRRRQEAEAVIRGALEM